MADLKHGISSAHECSAFQVTGRQPLIPHSRHRMGWSDVESDRLAEEHRAGTAVAALALSFGRTTAAIEHKLVEMGLVLPDECQFGGAPRDRRARTVPRDSREDGQAG